MGHKTWWEWTDFPWLLCWMLHPSNAARSSLPPTISVPVDINKLQAAVVTWFTFSGGGGGGGACGFLTQLTNPAAVFSPPYMYLTCPFSKYKMVGNPLISYFLSDQTIRSTEEVRKLHFILSKVCILWAVSVESRHHSFDTLLLQSSCRFRKQRLLSLAMPTPYKKIEYF